MVRLREVFPHGPGFVLVFDYMLSDLAEVVRNSEKPLTEVFGLVTCVSVGATDLSMHVHKATAHDSAAGLMCQDRGYECRTVAAGPIIC